MQVWACLLYVGKAMKYIISLKKACHAVCEFVWRTERFSSTFSLTGTEIFQSTLKICLRGLREVVREAAMIASRWSLRQRLTKMYSGILTEC